MNLYKTPTDFFNVFLIGLTTGSVYALITLGYTLVYGILQLINFAHGDVFALTGLFASSLIANRFNLDENSGALVIIGGLAAVFLIAMIFGAVVNSTIELVAYRRLRHAPRLAPLHGGGTERAAPLHRAPERREPAVAARGQPPARGH